MKKRLSKSRSKKTRLTKVPTTARIEKLYTAGKIEELRKLNEKLAKTANQRMAQLYKSGIKSTAALDRAQYYIWQESGLATGGVFSRSKKISSEKLLEQMKEILIFLRDPSSTVTGEKDIRFKKSFYTLTHGKDGGAPYMPIPENIKVPTNYEGGTYQYFEDKFRSFVKNDVWKDIKKYMYAGTNEYNSVLKDSGENLARGAKLSDLTDAYKQYLKNEITIYEMWDNWFSIK